MEKAGGGKKITRGQATSFGFRKATPEPPPPKKTTQEQCNSFGFRKPTATEQAGPFSAKKNAKPEPVSVKKTEQPAVTVQETIQPLLIAPVRPKSQNSCGARPKETKPVNRFGFRGPQLSNKVADVDASSSHSLVHADSVIEIQQLDHSPSMTNKFRQTQHQLQLQHELNLQQQREEQIQQQMAYSSNDETGDEGFETSTEEKQIRDTEANEKDILGSGESPSEEMWGRGEALCDEELCSSFAHIDKSPVQKLADEVSEALASVNPRLTGSRQSVSTLSPCDSLTSDDLMADFDTSDFDELDDAALKSELQNQSSQVMREWSNLLTSHPG
ncbi:unnamed protein product [Nezara viridula]|nr:unnamed protein product [Nezara viridula]